MREGKTASTIGTQRTTVNVFFLPSPPDREKKMIEQTRTPYELSTDERTALISNVKLNKLHFLDSGWNLINESCTPGRLTDRDVVKRRFAAYEFRFFFNELG